MLKHKGIKEVAGSLVIVEGDFQVKYEELVEVELADKTKRIGRVLEAGQNKALVQMFEETRGLDPSSAKVSFLGKTMTLKASEQMLGRVFDGSAKPLDNNPYPVPEKSLDINGSPINPYCREYPDNFVQTGISAIDGLNTLVRGQKLPIFSAAGLPHSLLATQIARQAKIAGNFSIVFGAMGITFEESRFFIEEFKKTGALARSVLFINTAADPVIERITLPRLALTTAEYLAFEKNYHVLVILTDMTNYCLTGDTEIILDDGTVLPIKDYVEKYQKVGGNLSQTSVLSFDKGLHQGNIKAVQKIPAPSKLFHIKTRSGATFRVTGDHKILVDTSQGNEMVPAQELSVGDEIYSAKKIDLNKIWCPTFLDLIQDADDLYVHFHDDIFNQQLKEKFGSITCASKELNLNYRRIVEPALKRCYAASEVKTIAQDLSLEFSKVMSSVKQVTSGKHEGIYWENEPISEEFLYLLGLIASDGTCYENFKQGDYYLSFSNKEEKLIRTFKDIINRLFPGVNVQIHSNQCDIKIARVNSRVLTHVARKLGIGKNNDLKPIFKLPEKWIAAFLAGYFDGDGTCVFYGNQARIAFTTNEENNAKRIQQLLKRIGIPSRIQIRKTEKTKSIKGRSINLKSNKIFDVVVSGSESVCDFNKYIIPYCSHPHKKKKLKKASQIYLNQKKGNKFSLAPRVCGKLIRNIRQRYDIKQTDIGFGNTVSQVENGKRRIQKLLIEKWVDKLFQLVLNDKDSDLQRLKALVSEENILDKIVEISKKESEELFVYDLTVEPAHNFLIENGLIVSNCEALREVSASRKEVPGRRGYPGYLYTDLATIYERAGLIQGKKGSVTQIPILTMPEDDKTHPIPDLTGYITEGQIMLSRGLYQQGIYPPIDVLPSLSRLRDKGIGQNKTREDHPGLANQLFACYARGQEIRELSVILGESSLSDTDRAYLRFAQAFEKEFLSQGVYQNREITETLDIGWQILGLLPRQELKRVKDKEIDKYLKKDKNEAEN